MKMLYVFLITLLLSSIALAMSKPPVPQPPPPDIGAKECGALPNTLKQTNPKGNQVGARFCIWKSKCPVVAGTVFSYHGLGEDELHPEGGTYSPLSSGGRTEFPDIAKMCLNIVTISHTRPAERSELTGMHEDWMIRPPGTVAKGEPSPPSAEHTRHLDFLAAKGLERPYVGYGQSMGGFNVYTAMAQYPSFFNAVMLTHPVMGDAPSKESCEACALGSPMYPILVMLNFTVWKEWPIANPVADVKKRAKLPKMFVSYCTADEQGIVKGPKDFVANAKAKGHDVTEYSFPLPCTHTDRPDAKTLEWLQTAIAK